MTRYLSIAAALMASPAAAHEAGGVFHFHPHGSEALVVALALMVAIVVWATARR